jgi:hypothetical protein
VTPGWLDEDDRDPRLIRRVQTLVRKRRARLDELERELRARQPDTWTMWVRQAELAAKRADYEYWRQLLRQLQR